MSCAAARRALPLQHGWVPPQHAATRTMLLQRGLCRCNTGCTNKTTHPPPLPPPPPVPLQQGLCEHWLCCYNTDCDTPTGFAGGKRVCRCNMGCAPSTCAAPLQHGLCCCYLDCTAATRVLNRGYTAAARAVPPQHGLRHCSNGCATAATAVPLPHGLCYCRTSSFTAARAVPLQHEPSQLICFESWIGCS